MHLRTGGILQKSFSNVYSMPHDTHCNAVLGIKGTVHVLVIAGCKLL